MNFSVYSGIMYTGGSIMKKLLFFVIICLFIACGTRSSQQAVDVNETVMLAGDARFVFPESSIVDTAVIRVEKKSTVRQAFSPGFRTSGTILSLMPDTIIFHKPVTISVPTDDPNAVFAAAVGKGFVPLARSRVAAETLSAEISHGGEYYVVSGPDRYGILHADERAGLLVVCDLYVSSYVEQLRSACREHGDDRPMWIFVYPGNKTIEDNARLLADELNSLHDIHGDFRCDVVSYGIGGLITHRYMNDTSLYNRDVSSAVIAVGTPFTGTNFARWQHAAAARSPYRFFYRDALGDLADQLAPGSEFMTWLQEHRKIAAGYYYDDIEENKNFASLRGLSPLPGTLPEEYNGDGLVSLEATLLTPIEPEPFRLQHFDLYENDLVLRNIVQFLDLYRSFTWPGLFSRVWSKETPFSRICEVWEQEARLMYGDVNYHVLLEWNENMLRSAPQGALLVTNGDNDTYPAWFLQQQGIRNDVLIVNRSLLNVTENVQFLMEEGLPLKLSDAELSAITYKKAKGGVKTRADQLIERLIREKKRPLVLSTTVFDPEQYGVPLTMVGMVYEIGERGVKIDGSRLDVARTKKMLFEDFRFTRYLSVPRDSLSDVIASMATNYAAIAVRLSQAFQQEGRYEEARQAVALAKQFTDNPFFTAFQEAVLSIRMEQYEHADSVLENMLARSDIDLSLRRNIAEKYYEMGNIRKAIEILGDCVKQDPASPGIPELIKRYQEEL